MQAKRLRVLSTDAVSIHFDFAGLRLWHVCSGCSQGSAELHPLSIPNRWVLFLCAWQKEKHRGQCFVRALTSASVSSSWMLMLSASKFGYDGLDVAVGRVFLNACGYPSCTDTCQLTSWVFTQAEYFTVISQESPFLRLCSLMALLGSSTRTSSGPRFVYG